MQAKGHISSVIKSCFTKVLEAAAELSKFQVAAVVVLVLTVCGGSVLLYLRSRPREVEIICGDTEEESSLLTVHVAGGVRNPGLYELPSGSRVADAIEKAGGVAEAGITDDINLARVIEDGEKITVALRGATPEQALEGPDERAGRKINVNTADVTLLEELPGVGPELAERIVEYRRKNGPFADVEELDNVEGIGPGKLDSIRDLATI